MNDDDDALAPRPAVLPVPVATMLDEIVTRADAVLTAQAPELSPERIAVLAPEIAARCTLPAGDLYTAGVHVGLVGAPQGPLVAHVVAAYLTALARICRRATAPVPTVLEVAEALRDRGVLGVGAVDIERACRAASLPLSSLGPSGPGDP